MSKFLIGMRLLLLAYLTYLVVFLMTDYGTPQGRVSMPFVLVVTDWINLFIHEGGHGIFQIFGQFIYVLGGSLMQVILPGAAVIVFLRSGIGTLPYTLFWLGQNIVNVSVYIMDAPYRRLPLISKYAAHDWGWITDTLGVMHLAEDFGLGVRILGILICLGGIGVGGFIVVQKIREELSPEAPLRHFPHLRRPPPPQARRAESHRDSDHLPPAE
jgi:hypothetical protein